MSSPFPDIGSDGGGDEVISRSSTGLLIDSALLFGLRIALFVACRRLILAHLFSEARYASLESSSPSSSSSSTATEEHELPTPATSYRNSTGSRSSRDSPRTLSALILGPGSGKDGWANAAGVLFGICFSESVTLFALVLFQAASLFDPSVRRWNWTLSLYLLLALVVIILPLGSCLLLTYRNRGTTPVSRRLAWAAMPFAIWAVVFLRVPLPQAMSANSGILDIVIARVAVIGVSMIAVLSGSGAVNAAWDTYEAFTQPSIKNVTPTDLRAAEDAFERTCSDLASRRASLEAIQSAPDPEANQLGFFERMWSGSQRANDSKSLQQEIVGLEAVAGAMRDDLDTMRRYQREAAYARTLQGRALLGLGHAFSVYCVFRVVLSTLNLLILGYRDTSPPDFIAYGLAQIFQLLDIDGDLDLSLWTRQISLLFVGALILVSMRAVLARLSMVFRAASAGVSTSFLVLFLAELMAIYLLATLIQLRTSLPASLTSSPSSSSPPSPSTSSPPTPANPSLLTTLPSFQVVFGSLFDSAFLLAAGITFAVRWLGRVGGGSVGGSGAGGVLFGNRD